MRATASTVRRIARRARRICAELSYAQRRSFEIRTGVPIQARHAQGVTTTMVDQPERLYRLPAFSSRDHGPTVDLEKR